jgi:nucleotide-binding universal stress UspA family protein
MSPIGVDHMQISAPHNQTNQLTAAAAGAPQRRLLCATDLTTRSERAMQRAGLLARQMNAKVFFVHAVDDSAPGRVVRMKVNRAYARLMRFAIARVSYSVLIVLSRVSLSAEPGFVP